MYCDDAWRALPYSSQDKWEASTLLRAGATSTEQAAGTSGAGLSKSGVIGLVVGLGGGLLVVGSAALIAYKVLQMRQARLTVRPPCFAPCVLSCTGACAAASLHCSQCQAPPCPGEGRPPSRSLSSAQTDELLMIGQAVCSFELHDPARRRLLLCMLWAG